MTRPDPPEMAGRSSHRGGDDGYPGLAAGSSNPNGNKPRRSAMYKEMGGGVVGVATNGGGRAQHGKQQQQDDNVLLASPSTGVSTSSPTGVAESGPPPVAARARTSSGGGRVSGDDAARAGADGGGTGGGHSPSRLGEGRRGSPRPGAAAATNRSPSSQQSGGPEQQHPPHHAAPAQQQEGAIVTPELLVDALSGHEDGLLAIAERLMEHYDSGYDAMGEAIIDAFADVQKLFQHVVEAAHMEGAAFEASRREEEIVQLRKQAAAAAALSGVLGGDANGDGTVGADAIDPYDPASVLSGAGAGGIRRSGSGDASKDGDNHRQGGASTPNAAGAGAAGAATSPGRHDEFIDQDVRDVLLDAIRRGTPMRDAANHVECFSLYEKACHSASALLPVDSDHRGRLQLSIARAESMSADRGCAILKYAMDDVLRSGLASGARVILPDPSKRGDCVLTRPTVATRDGNGGIGIGGDDNKSVSSHMSGGMSGIVAAFSLGSTTRGTAAAGVVQSSEEALASLVEEMKEIIGAPVYEGSPLQDVAKRFWAALSEAQRASIKTEERLEHNLGTLKGEYLLAREEWEEKVAAANEETATYKKKYQKLKESQGNVNFMEHARAAAAKLNLEQTARAAGGAVSETFAGVVVGNETVVVDGGFTGFQSAYGDNNTTAGSSTTASPRFGAGGIGGGGGGGVGGVGGAAPSVASFSSGLAQHARSLVGSLACYGAAAGAAGGGGGGGGGKATYSEEEDEMESMHAPLRKSQHRRNGGDAMTTTTTTTTTTSHHSTNRQQRKRFSQQQQQQKQQQAPPRPVRAGGKEQGFAQGDV